MSSTLWPRASSSKAGPVITPIGAAVCRGPGRRCRRVGSCVRDSPHERARRAVGSLVAIPRRRSLPRLRKDNPRPQGRVASTGRTAVGRPRPVDPADAPFGVPSVWACEPRRVEVICEPKRATAVLQVCASRKVDQAAMLPYPARWRHMSQKVFSRPQLTPTILIPPLSRYSKRKPRLSAAECLAALARLCTC